MNAEIALAAERSISGQNELLTTLSIAVIGGVLAILAQINLQNSETSRAIILRYNFLMWLSILAAMVTIGLSYIISGMLVEMSPQIFSTEFDVTRPFSAQNFGVAPIKILQKISGVQFVSFLLSIIFGAVFIMINIGRRSRDAQTSNASGKNEST